MFAFEPHTRDRGARSGQLTTPHGIVETPSFVAVGTLGTLKAISVRDLHHSQPLFLEALMGQIGTAIREGKFLAFWKDWASQDEP